MANRSIGLALAVWCVGATGVFAQGWPTNPCCYMGAEPIPCGSSCNLVPGPMTPEQAPPGPPPELALPANLPNAFSPPPCYDKHVYFHFGAFGLRRELMGRTSIAAFANGAEAQNFNDVETTYYVPGPRGTLGICCGPQSIELTGFSFASQDEVNAETIAPGAGQLSAFFVNDPFGLYANTDFLRTSLRTLLSGGELNYKCPAPCCNAYDFLLGVRYLDFQERVAIFTDNAFGTNDPTQQATYSSRTFNRLLGAQIGVEGEQGICKCFAFSWSLKAAYCINFVDSNILLQRGDGVVGLQSTDSRELFSHVYEGGAFIDFWFAERGRFRVGYQGLWMLRIAEAVGQVDFNLGNPSGIRDDEGSVFFHGPVAELQFLF